MDSNWNKVKLEDVVERINTGLDAIKRAPIVSYPTQIKCLRIQDISQNKSISDWGCTKVKDSDYENYRLRKGEIIMARTCSTGINFLVKDDLNAVFNNGLARIRVKKSKVNEKFLFYIFRSSSFINYINGISCGTSVQLNMKVGDLSNYEFLLPSLFEQNKIANILGTLDEKIEINKKTNKTLEGIAKALFKSWFVDFDPVKAKSEGRSTGLPDEISNLFPDSFEDSELGAIPTGWDVSVIGDISENFDKKRVPLSKEERSQRKGNFPYFGATGVFDYIDDFLFDGVYLLIGEDGSVETENGTAFTQYVKGKIWVNNHAHVLNGIDPISTEFLYCFFQFFKINPYITGAVQLKLSQGRMNMISLPLADSNCLKIFDQQVKPIFSKIILNKKESQVLERIRDTLLPKLISGDLSIPDAEKMIEELGI